MIKFFRHIRKSFLEQNKMGRYFKYAIGEILLVVIGILIALQINNWNETRKDNIKARSYLLNIKEDLKKDTSTFNKAIVDLKYVTEDTEFMLDTKDFKKHKFDSIVDLLPIVYYEYAINAQTFNKLINSGITDLGGETELFDNINNYYTVTSNYYYSVRNWDIEQTTQEGDFFYNNSFELPSASTDNKQFFSVQSNEEKLSAFSDLILSVEARNKLRNSYSRKIRMRETFERTKQAATELLSLINTKLSD